MSDGAILRMERLNDMNNGNANNRAWIDDFDVLTLTEYLGSNPVDNQGDASFTGVWHSAKAFLEYIFTSKSSSTSTTSSNHVTNKPTINMNTEQQYNGDSHQGSGFFVNETVQLHGNILELGAATGWLGITLARNIKDIQHVVLVDNADTGAVEWTRRNYAAAQTQGLPHIEKVSVQALNWSNAVQLQHVAKLHSWDFILGSDLVYSEEGAHALAKCMVTLLRDCHKQQPHRPRLLYAHTVGRMPELDGLWEATLKRQGLTFTIVAKLPIQAGGETWGGRFASIMDIRVK